MQISNAGEHPFNSIARQANKLMDQMQKGFYVYSGETWTPNVNLYETVTGYLVCVDLAGVDKQKIDVEVVDQRLRLRGTRAVPSHDEVADPASHHQGVSPERSADHDPTASHAAPRGSGAQETESSQRKVRVHLMEIDHGAFSREVELPLDVNKQNISANYRNGMLWIEIPKA